MIEGAIYLQMVRMDDEETLAGCCHFRLCDFYLIAYTDYEQLNRPVMINDILESFQFTLTDNNLRLAYANVLTAS